MQSIETLVIEAVRRLLDEKPYDKIRIQDICAEAHISRNTFSRHFGSKDGVVEAKMRADFVLPVRQLNALMPASYSTPPTELMLERFFQSFYENRAFYEGLARCNGWMWVVEKIGCQMRELNKELWADMPISSTEVSFICSMFAFAHPIIIAWWVEEGMASSPSEVARMTNDWLHARWREDAGLGRISMAGR